MTGNRDMGHKDEEEWMAVLVMTEKRRSRRRRRRWMWRGVGSGGSHDHYSSLPLIRVFLSVHCCTLQDAKVKLKSAREECLPPKRFGRPKEFDQRHKNLMRVRATLFPSINT